MGLSVTKSAVVLSVVEDSVIQAKLLEEEISEVYRVPGPFPPSVQDTVMELSKTPVKVLAPGTDCNVRVVIEML